MSIIAQLRADRHRLLTKAAQSLLGICTGLIADGSLNDREIRFLALWIKDNEEAAQFWPGDIISQRINSILADGVITDDERKDLVEMLVAITGTDFIETGSAAPTSPTTLPIDDSETVIFVNKEFCFTGKFIYGNRQACQRSVVTLGGIAAEKVTGRLDYLVVGSLINSTWAYEAHGRKIEQAAVARQQSGRPRIISESHWVNALKSALLPA